MTSLAAGGQQLPTPPAARAASPVRYQPLSAAEGCFWAALNGLLDGGAKRFCDVGGGAKPILSLSRVQALDLHYVVFDESQAQLDRAPAGYQHFCGDVLDARSVAQFLASHGTVDVVMSRWTAEHVSDGMAFHAHVYEMLRPGGTALHFFPTLYALPFVVNRVLSHELSSALLFRAFKARKVKFPAQYSCCRGPTRRQIRRLQAHGYSLDCYTGFFGHSFYARVRPLHWAHRRFAQLLLAHPAASMTSFALLVMTRPA